MEPDWSAARWRVCVNGIADAYLGWLTLDGWELACGNPARGSLVILTPRGGDAAGIAVAQWIADVMAYDHDAPIDASPMPRRWGQAPADREYIDPLRPLSTLAADHPIEYWENLSLAHWVVAERRFGCSYLLRYDDERPGGAGPEFSIRFPDDNARQRVALYAMAARQFDVMSEYLCLYRLLECADGKHGMKFSAKNIEQLEGFDFGSLYLAEDYDSSEVNAFAQLKARALAELDALSSGRAGCDVPAHLYALRNGLVHGKTDVVVSGRGDPFLNAARALPIVKLLARMAVSEVEIQTPRSA